MLVVRCLLLIRNANDIKLLAISRAGKIRKPANRYDSIKILGDNIVSASEFAEWRRHRLLCNPAYVLLVIQLL